MDPVCCVTTSEHEGGSLRDPVRKAALGIFPPRALESGPTASVSEPPHGAAKRHRPTSAKRSPLSAPQLARCQCGALCERLQLRPRNLRMHSESQAAIRAGDHALAADDV